MSIEVQKPVSKSHARDLDPNVLQRRASDPDHCVWVNASAGTGKTKVLSDRVLRLLLPRQDGRPGTPAYKVLCLTFTKAGASEMQERIHNILSEWAICDDNTLTEKLKNLLGHLPSKEQYHKARTLFCEIIDGSKTINIMTIHAFCQSILGRFPLEAGLSPHFTIIEETESKALITQAIETIYKKDHQSSGVQHLVKTLSESQFTMLIQNCLKERYQLRQTPPEDALNDAYAELLGFNAQLNAQSLIDERCDERHFPRQELTELAQGMLNYGGKRDQERGEVIAHWLSLSSQKERAEHFLPYSRAYLKADDDFYQSLISKKCLQENPHLESIIQIESQRVHDIVQKIKLYNMANMSKALLGTARQILDEYERLKKHQAVLDYDDLIFYVTQLLKDTSLVSWVQYKLDQKIDHILVDEAQDTNPEQWRIIDALSDEFFAGETRTAQENIRTVFVVGDEKQSIYSFQRAAPEEFHAMRQRFKARAKNAHLPWSDIDMNISFRSTDAVLRTVDHVFNHPQNIKGVTSDTLQHIPYRRGQAGCTTLWPLFYSDIQDNEDTFGLPLPSKITETQSGHQKCAAFIADQIKNWLDQKTLLPSKNRPIKADDIMILVRTRSSLSFAIIKALKKRKIPLGGADRIFLAQELAVQDIIALIEVMLLPLDDLNLACVLKSPLIGMSEENLFDLAAERKGSLWDALTATRYQDIHRYLENLIVKSRALSPHDFIYHILNHPCPADERSGFRTFYKRLGHDVRDILELMLDFAHHFETQKNCSLQYFLNAFQKNESNIKREQENISGAVRIMTVHGSKGLQAPIVILPDTIRTTRTVPNQIDRRLLWPQKTGLSLPLFTARKNDAPQFYNHHYNILEERADEEYRRLLYVAMTRAEDQLYITGAVGKKDPIDESWYFAVKRGFESCDITQTSKIDAFDIAHIENPQTREPEQQKTHHDDIKKAADLPNWALNPAPQEPSPPSPIRPSQQTEIKDNEAVFNPSNIFMKPQSQDLNPHDLNPMKKGIITHKILQYLPDIADHLRDDKALKYLEKYGSELSDAHKESILSDVKRLLQHPDYAEFFQSSGRSEVPLSGVVGKYVVNAQIDRLIVSEDRIWIIDYKTNQHVPNTLSATPKAYIQQMALYRALVSQIYPNHEIDCALLWTSGPEMTIIPSSLMDKALP